MVCGGGFRAIFASARSSNDVTTHAATSARLARRGEPSQGVVVGDTLTGRNGGSLRGDYVYVRPAEAFFARPIPPPVLPDRPLPLREAVDALRALATDEDDAALELAALLTVADAPLVPGAPLPSRLTAPQPHPQPRPQPHPQPRRPKPRSRAPGGVTLEEVCAARQRQAPGDSPDDARRNLSRWRDESERRQRSVVGPDLVPESLLRAAR